MLLSVTPIDDGLAVEGELDMATAPILDTAVREAAPSTGQILLDFAGVSFMDSTGLRLLLQSMQEKGGDKGLVILHPISSVRKVFDISTPGGGPGLEVRD